MKFLGVKPDNQTTISLTEIFFFAGVFDITFDRCTRLVKFNKALTFLLVKSAKISFSIKHPKSKVHPFGRTLSQKMFHAESTQEVGILNT